jgi:hypothetical protein
MAAGNRDDSEKVTTQFVWKIPWIIKKSKENRVTGAWNTSSLTIQSGPATALDHPPETLFPESLAKMRTI